MIVIDFLELIPQTSQIEEIINKLKHLALELDTPILCLSQLPRTIDEKNPDVTKTVKVALNSYLFDMPCAKDIMAKYKENAVSIGNEQEIFTSYLQDKKEVDCTKQEQRIKLATTYNSWTDLEEARTEVMSKLG